MVPIYVSTGAFKSNKIEEILDIAYDNDIRYLELSSGMIYHERVDEIIQSAKRDFHFLIHNYFPAPSEPFTLNLAASNGIVRQKSIELCKNAIYRINELGEKFYSVHCGFTFSGTGTELGNSKQLELPRIPLSEAKDNFVKNLRELCRYAQQYKVDIAIENNVVAQYAAKEKDLYLGVSTLDLQEIVDMVQCDNLRILLDLAHAKVSDTFLNFGLENMVNDLNDQVIAVHISENNGYFDQNNPLHEQSKLLKLLKLLKEKTIILEAYNLEPREIKSQIQLIREAL